MTPQSERAIDATCPECRGPLTEVIQSGKDTEIREYKCLVGHRYGARTVLHAHFGTQERQLWAAVLVLEESANLVRLIAPTLSFDVAHRLEIQSQKKLQQAATIRKILEELEPFDTA